MFGAAQQSSPSIFGTPPSSTTPLFGTPSSMPSLFGTPASTPAFGQTPATSTPLFGQTPAFGTPSASAFGTGFGASLFSTPAQQQTTPFQSPGGGFGFSSPFGMTQTAPFGQQAQQQQQQMVPFGNAAFGSGQLTTQMAPVAPLPFSMADRDIQAIIDAYKDEPTNSKYAFKYLLFSVTDPQLRMKLAGVSDIMWAEAMGKLEGLESSMRERLWPQLVKGFKDLSDRLKLQDEVILSDSERLQMTRSNVKLLQSHFQAETLPQIERMRQHEKALQRRLLRLMRILEALEGRGFRLPLTKAEAELAEKLAGIIKQLKGSGAELSRRVQSMLTLARAQSNGPAGGSAYLPGSAKIHDQSLSQMQEVLQRQTEAIARLGNVLKRDTRDLEIIMSEDTQMTDGRT